LAVEQTLGEFLENAEKQAALGTEVAMDQREPHPARSATARVEVAAQPPWLSRSPAAASRRSRRPDYSDTGSYVGEMLTAMDVDTALFVILMTLFVVANVVGLVFIVRGVRGH
jgi:hypothetical protein